MKTSVGAYALQLECVSREFAGSGFATRAVDNVSVVLKSGEFVAICGPSGSGKSTLLNLMGALDRPDTGEVFIDGTATSSLNDRKLTTLRRRRIGFVFQFFNLFPTLVAWENVALPQMLDGRTLREIRPAAEALLCDLGLGERLGHRLAQLSGGELQRVAIARALITEPAVVLADEPTGSLDSETGAQVITSLRELCHAGNVALVVVTHDYQVAAAADRRLVMRDGRLMDEQ